MPTPETTERRQAGGGGPPAGKPHAFDRPSGSPEADVNEHEALVDEAIRTKHTVLLIGGLDTGKTTLARDLLRAALSAGRPAALLDADVGQKSVGPPATVTLKVLRGPEDLEPEALARLDALSFVGATSAQGHLLPVVTGVSALHEQAKQMGAD